MARMRFPFRSLALFRLPCSKVQRRPWVRHFEHAVASTSASGSSAEAVPSSCARWSSRSCLSHRTCRCHTLQREEITSLQRGAAITLRSLHASQEGGCGRLRFPPLSPSGVGCWRSPLVMASSPRSDAQPGTAQRARGGLFDSRPAPSAIVFATSVFHEVAAVPFGVALSNVDA